MTGLAENLAHVQRGIETACERTGRAPEDVTLIVVTKTLPLEAVLGAHALGVRDFGENYVQELKEKAPALPEARWHFIGSVQSGTANQIASLANYVHGLEPGRAAGRLARRAASRHVDLAVLIQVDFLGDRNGVAPENVEAFAAELEGMNGVALRGLMTLPPMPKSPEDSRPYFARLRDLRDGLQKRYPQVVELSMGMSLDYEVAVEEGATMVRVGTALFGERTKE